MCKKKKKIIICHLAYGNPSVLKFGNRSVISQEGAQQGDPLGPLLFCLAIHPILTSLSSNLVAGYLDDITLGGDEKTLAHDVSTIRARGEAMGLKLNVRKCEFINKDAKATKPIFSDFILLDTANATLLGAPLTAGNAMDDALAGRCKDLALTIDRLKLLSAHDALILFRTSFSSSKILHTLRSSPCAGHPTLDQFDSLLRNGLCTTTNSDLSDMQCIQAQPAGCGWGAWEFV